jgi:hypothetical protein
MWGGGMDLIDSSIPLCGQFQKSGVLDLLYRRKSVCGQLIPKVMLGPVHLIEGEATGGELQP